MSWIFGFYSKKQINEELISKYHPHPITSVRTPKYYIAAGGNNNTLLFNKDNFKVNYFISGVPISSDASKFVSKIDFDELLSSDLDKLKLLNGHFCGVVIKDNSLHLFTDQLGLREFHIYENNFGWYFSTRLDWLLKLDKFEIDFNEFGSRWLLINQLSNKSIIKNVYRLNCGATASLKDNECKYFENNWIPEKSKFITTLEYKSKLEKLTLLGLSNNRRVTLSLSGGMDSRVILSLLLNSDYKNWGCYILKTEDKADKQIAEKILTDLKIQYKLFADEYPDENYMLSELFNYIGATYLTGSSFNSLKLFYYRLFPNNEIIVDGGFGEIWRREFLNRLYIFGKKDIEEKNFDNIFNHLTNNKADIFSTECSLLMKKGGVNQIEKLFSTLPPHSEIGLGNWLDLFSIKTRLVNFYAQEQARVDNYVTSYMPFVQPYLLNDILNLPVEDRLNNRLFKRIIRSDKYGLSKYNLAKGDISYPFYFSPIMKRIYSKFYDKLKRPATDDNHDKFLFSLKSFILDSLHSKPAREYAPYNYDSIYKEVNSYYNGDKSRKKYVDWFLTFEIFRQIIEYK
jgi:hypothetical protein